MEDYAVGGCCLWGGVDGGGIVVGDEGEFVVYVI